GFFAVRNPYHPFFTTIKPLCNVNLWHINFYRTELRDSHFLCPIHPLYRTDFHDSYFLCPIHPLYRTEFHDFHILCPIYPLYQTEFCDSSYIPENLPRLLGQLHQKLHPTPNTMLPSKKYLLPTKETGNVKFHLFIY